MLIMLAAQRKLKAGNVSFIWRSKSSWTKVVLIPGKLDSDEDF